MKLEIKKDEKKSRSALHKEAGLIATILQNMLLYLNQKSAKKRRSLMIVYSFGQRKETALVILLKIIDKEIGLINTEIEFLSKGGTIHRFWECVKKKIPEKEVGLYTDEYSNDYAVDILNQTSAEKKLTFFALEQILKNIFFLSKYSEQGYLSAHEMGSIKGRLLEKTHNEALDELMHFLIFKQNIIERFSTN